jgi:hypothetical protein
VARPSQQEHQIQVAPAPLQEVDVWLERFRGFWSQHLDALATELARGKRERRTNPTSTTGHNHDDDEEGR